MKMTAFAASFILTAILMPLAIIYSRKNNLLDYPKEKSIHTAPVPMTGGIVIFSVFFILSLVFRATANLLPLFLASLPVLASGLYDDIKGLNAAQKLSIQFISAIVLISCGVLITSVKIPFGTILNLGSLSMPVTILWLIFMINLVNLLDGLDGLAAGLCAIVFLVLAVVTDVPELGIQLAVFIGAVTAFLLFNFHPAKIFLGNNGSSFLGLAAGYFSLMKSQKSTIIPILIVPLGILLIQVFDIAFTVLRRARKGANIFKGDKYHIHHLMLNVVKDHRLTVLLFYLFSALFAFITIKLFL